MATQQPPPTPRSLQIANERATFILRLSDKTNSRNTDTFRVSKKYGTKKSRRNTKSKASRSPEISRQEQPRRQQKMKKAEQDYRHIGKFQRSFDLSGKGVVKQTDWKPRFIQPQQPISQGSIPNQARPRSMASSRPSPLPLLTEDAGAQRGGTLAWVARSRSQSGSEGRPTPTPTHSFR
eukprot:m.83972 g.83972  ORF g.83972 m.83972 type:complete len:179 (-) comp25693_c0_seq1:259-795(-)